MKRLLISIMMLLLLVTVSCGGGETSVPTVDQTQMAEEVNLALTQAASTAELTTTPAVEGAASQLVETNGIALMLPSGIAAGVEGEMLNAQGSGGEGAEWEARPASVVLTMSDYAGPQGDFEPQVQVFVRSDYEQVSQATAAQVQDLRTLLAEKPADPREVAYLPLVNAKQLLNAQVRYLNFPNGKGVRFLAHYGQDVSPVSNQSLTYLFFGITDDDLYLVSASFPVAAAMLPTTQQSETPSGGIPFPDEQAQSDLLVLDKYLVEVSALLESTQAQQFTPSLGLFDALVTSLEVNPSLDVQAPVAEDGTAQPTTATACTDIATFVSETIPDNSAFNPGQVFTKSWVLGNAGTCTWTSEYALVFSKGDQMGGASPIPLPKEVPPNGSVELKVELTAPTTPGKYSGEWKLQNAKTGLFGLGGSDPVWVRIDVSEVGSGLNLGTPDWRDSFDTDAGLWFLGDDEYMKGEIKDGALIWTAPKSGGDRWRVAYLYPIGAFYLEAHVRTGAACSGKDSYGLLLRANPNEADVYDSGTIVGVSCDGQFRIYSMARSIFRSVQDWTTSAAIKSGPNQTNVVGAWLEGDTLKLYINQQMVTEVRVTGEYVGLFGFMINGTETANFQVFIDEMAYWSLVP